MRCCSAEAATAPAEHRHCPSTAYTATVLSLSLSVFNLPNRHWSIYMVIIIISGSRTTNTTIIIIIYIRPKNGGATSAAAMMMNTSAENCCRRRSCCRFCRLVATDKLDSRQPK